jgi:hypothetical protein
LFCGPQLLSYNAYVCFTQNNAGVTVVTAEDFEKCHKFNLRQLTEPEGETLARKQQSEAAKAANAAGVPPVLTTVVVDETPRIDEKPTEAVKNSEQGSESSESDRFPDGESESDGDDKPAVPAPKLPDGKFARTKKDNRSVGTIRKYKNPSRKLAKP